VGIEFNDATQGSRSKIMTNVSQKIRKTITAGLGAALISTLFVVAAVGPATTATAATCAATAQA
jgi:hypothetical protein